MVVNSTVVWVALGGAAGSATRFLLAAAVTTKLGWGFPFGTLLVNVLGSFAIGLAHVWLSNSSFELRFLLIAGFLGGFTTFSAFSIETLLLVDKGRFDLAASYVALSVVLSLVAVFAGYGLGRSVAP
jgi:fluoride exporter